MSLRSWLLLGLEASRRASFYHTAPPSLATNLTNNFGSQGQREASGEWVGHPIPPGNDSQELGW